MGACFPQCPGRVQDGSRLMSPKISLLLTALLLAGCATTPGTSYYYDGDGDYYYGDASADVIVEDSGPSFGASGHGGWGYGHGYAGGFGYYGAGGYGGFYPSWYYGYPAYAWWLWPNPHDNGSDRMSRLQRDRAWRSTIAARPTIQAPMAKWDRDEAFMRQRAPLLPRQFDSGPRRFEGPAPAQNGPRVRPPPPSMSSPAPAPQRSQPAMRSTPVPMRPASRKQ